MQTRILAGCKRLLMAAAVASLAFLPLAAHAVTPAAKTSLLKATSHAGAVSEAEGHRNLRQPAFYPRSNYVWPFTSGPTYGEVDSSRWNDTGVVHTLVGSFDLTHGEPAFPSELRTQLKLSGGTSAQYFLLQVRPESFTNGAFDQLKATIASQGGAILESMPVGAFVARLNSAAYGAIAGSPTLLALFPYEPALKLSPMIGRVPLADPVKALSDTYSVQLLLFPGESPAAVVAALDALGGIKVTRTDAGTVYADVPVSMLAAVAHIEAIRQIFEDVPMYLMAEETTCTVQTGRLNNGAIPYHDAGVDGGGGSTGNPQILMVLDSGIQLDAGDLSNTRTDAGTAGAGHRKVLFYGTTNPFGGSGDMLGCDDPTSGGFTHGHTVSATALGNATAVPAGYGTGWNAYDTNNNPWNLDGVAPRAKEVFYDASVTPTNANCEDPLAGGAGINAGTLYTSPSGGSLADGYAKGARTVNFSWGGSSDVYDGNAQQIDQFIFDKGDAMVFVAAGNNGSDTGTDGIGEPNTIGAPATTKNGVAVGSSHNSDDQFDVRAPNDRSGFSSNGPGPSAGNRTLPLIMAPGSDVINGQGLISEYNCRSNDNDQNNPVQCDIVSALSGTSFASPAAAGAGLLIRDYFAQGFYPDGTASNPGNASDEVPDISGALVKAMLIDSADWMTRPTSGDPNAPGGNLSWKFRFNNEQGYGRVQLTNALPLETYPASVTGLIVADGGIAGGVNNTTLNTTLGSGASTSYALNVCDTSQPISIGLAWIEAPGDALTKNLDLELTSPSGRKYVGNYYTEDDNRNKVLDPSENCDYSGLPWPPDSSATLDQGPWSLPTSGSGVSCTRTTFNDTTNPTEGIHLSPDTLRNGINDNPDTAVDESADNQIEAGTWTVTVKAGNYTGTQNYALAIAGGVCLGSSVRIQKLTSTNQLAGGAFVCNDQAVVTVNELDEADDPAAGLTPAEISSRTTVNVIDAGTDGVFGTPDDVITDTETGLNFTQGSGLTFQSDPILLTEGTAPDPGNGVLDIRSGQQIQVIYQDKTSGSPDPNKKRVSTGSVNCSTAINAGGVNFGQFGMDTWTFVSGGCERDARGYFTFGYPDQYIDAGETVGYLVAFQSAETETLKQVQVSLKAVDIDGDSPANCKAGSVGVCADPNRTNNPPSSYITVLDSPINIGTLRPGGIATAAFTVQANASISGVQKADMVVGVSAKTAGKSVESYAVQRETLNADATTFYYNTDFPMGGASLNYDSNNNEILETVTNDPKSFLADYVFETRSYSDMTATGFNNSATIKAPWNFDTNNGGFTSGLNSNSTPSTITTVLAEWGEDKNFNDKLDGACTGDTSLTCTQGLLSQSCNFCNGNHTIACSVNADCTLYGGTCQNFGSCNYAANEDRDPQNSTLDQNWNTNGGCGWQTKGGGSTGGIWHTGTIRTPASSTVCLASGSSSARCQLYETLPLIDGNGNRVWWEMLLTPVLNKVNQCPSANGTNCPTADQPDDPVYQIAITDWAWNMELNIGDGSTGFFENFDTDLDKLQPVDMYNDNIILNGYLGQEGAIVGGNPPLFGGFQMFAPVISCVDTDGQGQCSLTTTTSCYYNSDCPSGETCTNFPDHCGTVAGPTCSHDYDCAGFGNNTNGTVGNNRSGANNCAFEGTAETDSTHTGADSAKALKPWALATPADDDAANGYCRRSDSLDTIDKSVSCTSNNQCFLAGAPYTTCDKPDTNADEFVQQNGPGRNFDIQRINGPDMRFSTLEDIYGPTGNKFQAAVEFYNFDPTSGTYGVGAPSYGFGIDDMFISWKETRLDEDTHDCSDPVNGGQCADIEMSQTRSADGNNLIGVTVTDTSPYDPDNPVNDCDQNGSFTDPGDSTDCNGNGKNDVIVRVSSIDESPGEIVALDETSPGSHIYKGNVPYSTTYDSPGTVFARANGTTAPVYTAKYLDRDDGTSTVGNIHQCHNALDPSQDGYVQASLTVFPTAGAITVKSYRVVLVGTAGVNGDDDGYPDRNETNDLYVTLVNRSHVALDNVVAALGTSDSKIDCVGRALVTIPHFGSGNPGDADPITVETPTPFEFKVGDVQRSGLYDDFSASFTLTLHSNAFDVTSQALNIKIPMDLSATGGGSTTPFVEDFEAKKGLGAFTWQTLDAGKDSLTLSDGFRCQYNNPDFVNTNSPNRPNCFLGFAGDPNSGVNDWHLHLTSGTGAARAYTGNQSMHYGVHVNPSNSVRDTMRLKQLDAVVTSNPINLPQLSANPELTFFQQYNSDDGRFTNTPSGQTVDRGVVEVQLANGSTPVGNWIKIYPYENEYDEQGTDFFSNCIFDPTDDGNNEDSFFDPTDPNRRLGPSSTCFPEFAFGWQGDTDWRNTFNPDNTGYADGQGYQGSINRGTWVQPKFDLANFAARSIFLRFVMTTIEIGTTTTYDGLYQTDNIAGDDGWYVDNIHIDSAVSSPVTLSIDNTAYTPLATSCAACTTITPMLTANPASLSGPGQLVTLSATGSTIDRCPNGVPQYQFWIDSNSNGIVGDAGDTLLRDWTDSGSYLDTPTNTTPYAVKVRCSSQPSCDSAGNSLVTTVPVTCPSTGNAVQHFGQVIAVGKVGGLGGAEPDANTQVSWTTSTTADVLRGDLTLLRSGQTYTGTVLACNNDVTGTSAPADANDPGAGNGYYYLARPGTSTYCNAPNSYSTGNAKEAAGRDSEIAADGNACP